MSGIDLSESVLVKAEIDSDVIDLSIGEPKILTEILGTIHSLDSFACNKEPKLWEYPSPNGYAPLVELLEHRHQAKVIITNGAKQALAASFFALRNKGYQRLGMRLPYWALVPLLANHLGLNTCYVSPGDEESKWAEANPDSYLLIAPNNPDGYFLQSDEMLAFKRQLEARKMPLIHDAAYYLPIYCGRKADLIPMGDMQIYSISKMYGLSGLRLGYIVVHNEEYYRDLLWYMETLTVGVSNLSQKILFNLMEREEIAPKLKKLFETEAAAEFTRAHHMFDNATKEVLNVPLEPQVGMFKWVEVKRPDILERAKIKIIDGNLFGVPGMARINLGVGSEMIKKAVVRINTEFYKK